MHSKIGGMQAFWERQPSLIKYVAPRLAALVVCWLLATMAIFTLLFVLNDPVDRAAPPDATAQERDAVRHELKLDHAAAVLYVRWIGGMVHGDFGHDYAFNRSMSAELRADAQPSAELVIMAIMLGVLAVVGIDSLRMFAPPVLGSRLSELVAAVLASLPVFVVALFTVIVPAERWGYVPPLGHFRPFYRAPLVNFEQIGPASAVVALPVGAFILNQLKGVPRHSRALALVRAAMHSFPLAASGAIVVEEVWTIPGLGAYLLAHVRYDDMFVMRGVAALVAFVALALWILAPADKREKVARGDAMPSLRRPPHFAAIGSVLLAAFVIAGVIGPLAGPDGRSIDFSGGLHQGASWQHWLGTDELGRDELGRVLDGARRSLKFASAVVLFGTLPGVVAGVALGRYAGRKALEALDYASAGSAFPWLMALLIVLVTCENDMRYAAGILALGAFMAALDVARVAEVANHANRRGLIRACTPAALECVLAAAGLAVLAEATLGFLGFGTGFTSVSWGAEFVSASTFLPDHYLRMVATATPLCLTLFGIHLLRASLPTWWGPLPPLAPAPSPAEGEENG
jgi:peptide/nickel transport system permease protein